MSKTVSYTPHVYYLVYTLYLPHALRACLGPELLHADRCRAVHSDHAVGLEWRLALDARRDPALRPVREHVPMDISAGSISGSLRLCVPLLAVPHLAVLSDYHFCLYQVGCPSLLQGVLGTLSCIAVCLRYFLVV